ncbi:gliding-associated putative ABC transporter substrate-binding component GldG [Cnuella takakiae]|uniref:Gliding-associated putative ABC transporter substrate-binding component GldG n=1 Tax=Cnuella takakiae TaxID=1302690 RepID=A0A1M5I099_9BACT|nr:gliding motility-associated ABC transporter substrate-binding protein GldG [Cnuella takakiae]OLY91392.1 gliding motility-associated ABC transporter substrate-binding protein GldG [Cnuella takakiae]SHG21480.1 gliding-associated putative ABC transporter substrate-binding component GldG [Cnuella takakiae]
MNKLFGNKKIGWIVLLVALVLVNVLASLLHVRADLTEEKRYSLSAPTKELLRGLDSTVQIDVLLEGDDLPAVVRRFRNAVGEFLFEAKQYGGNKVQFRFINPYADASDTAATRRLEDSLQYYYGLNAVLFNAPEKVGDELEVKKLVHGAVVRYGDKAVGVDFLKGARSFGTEAEQLAALYNNVEASLEYNFGSAIQKVTAKKKPTVAYMLGNGESWGPTVDDAVRTLFTNYYADTLNIREFPYIPKQIDALVFVKPTIPFSDAEKLKIDQYVMNGGKVLWMVDNMYAEFDSLYKSNGFVAYDRGLNLEDLLFNYGVRINQSLLQDMQADQLPQVSGEGQGQQQRFVSWPFFPILNGTNHPISKNLDGVRSMFPTTLDTVAASGVAKTFLLHSSNNARVLPAPAKIDFTFLQIAPEEKEFTQRQVPVAVLLEGDFRSLYTGRVPRAVADSLAAAGMPVKYKVGGNNKIIVVADGDIAMNQYSQFSGPLPMGQNLFTQYTFANKDFFLNSLEYLVNPSNILQTRAKEFSLRLLDPRRVKAEQTTWQLVNVALPIALMILFGFVYQQLRKRKYAR